VVFCPRGLGGYLNSDTIVRAIPLVRRRCSDVLFVFVSGAGGVPELEKHQALARELGVEESILWEGHVPWEEMPHYYVAADVMVSISSEDSLPNCLLESMACGVPPILGDIPQMREWAVDGQNCFLVPPRSPEILADRILRIFNETTGAAASFADNNFRLVAENFAMKKNVPKIKDLVTRVAGSDMPQGRG
jgi:glycosyltransferase involved in cell wall biosynthesis